MSWRGCLGVQGLCLTVIAVMTSSPSSPGWSTQGLRQLEMMSQRGQHEPLSAQHLHGDTITAENGGVVRVSLGVEGGDSTSCRGEEMESSCFCCH